MFRKVDRLHLRLILGGMLAVATLVPLSIPISGGAGAYKAFLKNSEKHTSTPLTNYMGWRTVMSFKDTEATYLLRTDRLEDPWKDWKDARLRTFHQREWLYWAGVLAFMALLYAAVRGFAAWESAALSAILIAVIPELTCYYYSFLIVPALLWAKRQEVGLALLAITAGTGFADMAPTQYLPSNGPFWNRLNHLMPTWLAEQYTLMSAITLVGIVYVLYEFGFIWRNELTPVAEGAAVAAAPAAVKGKVGGKKTGSQTGGSRPGGPKTAKKAKTAKTAKKKRES
jgi:hypothetical protein